ASTEIYSLSLHDALPIYAEVRHGHGIAVHRIVAGDRPHAVDAMRHDLVAVEIEVHPVGVAASLLAAENAAVEGARLLDVGDRERSEEHTSELQSRENLVC